MLGLRMSHGNGSGRALLLSVSLLAGCNQANRTAESSSELHAGESAAVPDDTGGSAKGDLGPQQGNPITA